MILTVRNYRISVYLILLAGYFHGSLDTTLYPQDELIRKYYF